ncbi:MAG: hypothetical protein B7O98_03275 [Zestosphaera tikiterensis]|uniref:Uncharacterized protein n=1 Tax=Zestosphaera tikiterensis TaxID=1973259 RepID=A0A2R7Y7D6_9CREN|nr:MAG: hypothetical protein B7O98_03275 [Zestosphaera tikiterensis]
MPKVTLLGLGRVGYFALKYLTTLKNDVEIVAVDKDPSKASLVKDLNNVEFVTLKEESNLLKYIRGVDLVMVSLPSSVAYRYLERVLRECVNVVDVSFISEDPYTLSTYVEKCRTFYVPDAGFAPGFSNLLVGEAQEVLSGLDDVEIYVGGIPQEPVPPLGYVVTWNAEDLIEEYLRKARIILDGKLTFVDPLDKILEVDIEGFGRLEGFYSDGLRTLIRNVKARNMFEVTLRWPGHLKAMKLLKQLGLMDKEHVKVDEVDVIPAKFLARLLEMKLKMEVNDVAILEVRASKDSKRYLSKAILKGTPKEPATTVFTAAVFAVTSQIALTKSLGEGVKPLEELYMFKEEFVTFLNKLGCYTYTSFSR